MQSRTFITLATLNGAPFLADQIESLQNQSWADWTLLVRDDGSIDETRGIAARYADSDSRIEVLERTPVALAGSAVRNFSLLFSEAYERGAYYVFSCDQDDVWHSSKLSIMLEQIRKAEGDGATPVLVHHDLSVVDDRLAPVADSYWQLSRIRPGDEKRPQRLYSRNEVTGCAMGCNRALLEAALPIPEQAVMHDWWMALVAAHFGKLRCLSERLVNYRQHDANVIGARSFWSGLNAVGEWGDTWHRGNLELSATISQAQSFHERYGHLLKPDVAEALDAYRGLPGLGRLQRLRALRAAGVWRHRWLLDMTLVLRLMLLESGD